MHPVTEFLRSRRSQTRVGLPAPNEQILNTVFEAAFRAPDHGWLHPYRILVLREAGQARLASAWANYEARKVGAPLSEEQRLALFQKTQRAPMIIAVVASPKQHPKIPQTEQHSAATNVAYGIVMGLEAEGFGAIWRTGEMCRERAFLTELGLSESETIAAFIYTGTVVTPDGPAPSVRVSDFVSTLE